MSTRTERPWLNIFLGLLCIVAIVVAYTTVGQASSRNGSGSRVVTAQTGVVQSTVSGSGNIQAASQLNLGFKTSGTVTHIYVTQGEHVTKGQLLATLDPQSAEVTLEQAKASLQSAEANLAKEEETNGETSTGQSSTGSGGGNGSTASTASVHHATEVSTDVTAPTAAVTASRTQARQVRQAQTATTPTTTSPSTAPTTTTPSTAPTTTTPNDADHNAKQDADHNAEQDA